MFTILDFWSRQGTYPSRRVNVERQKSPFASPYPGEKRGPGSVLNDVVFSQQWCGIVDMLICIWSSYTSQQKARVIWPGRSLYLPLHIQERNGDLQECAGSYMWSWISLMSPASATVRQRMGRDLQAGTCIIQSVHH